MQAVAALLRYLLDHRISVTSIHRSVSISARRIPNYASLKRSQSRCPAPRGGSNTPWASAEDVDYPLRALLSGGRVEYRPDIHVTHAFGVHGNPRQLAQLGMSLGGGVGYVLRRHRFPVLSSIEILLVRPAGGLVMGLLRGSLSEVSFYAGTLYGKVRGWITA